MANITPEAMGDDRVNSMLNSCGDKRVEVTMDMLRKSYMTLDSGNDGNDDVSLVALGNPHLRCVATRCIVMHCHSAELYTDLSIIVGAIVSKS